MDFLRQTLNILMDLLTILIVLRIVCSWMLKREDGMMEFLHRTTEPILAPLRRILPRIGMFDFSPLVALVLLDALRELINSFL